jgi:hypothetical protein
LSLLARLPRQNQLRIGFLHPRRGRQDRGAGRQSTAHVEGQADKIRQLLDRAAAVRQRPRRHGDALVHAGAATDLRGALSRQAGRIEPRG